MRSGWLLATLLTGQVMANVDIAIVNVAAPSIRDGLHAAGGQLDFVVSGYTVAFAMLLITGARLGDTRGHRRVFLLGLAGFTIASLACGLAPGAVGARSRHTGRFACGQIGDRTSDRSGSRPLRRESDNAFRKVGPGCRRECDRRAIGVPATAAGPVSPRIVTHFNFTAGQTPENAVVEPDGSTDVSFAIANQVAHVTRDGTVSLLAQFPSSGKCGIFPGPATLGLARAHEGTVYVVECSGNASTGVWRLRRGSAPVQIATLPPTGLPNGMAIDDRTGNLYVADSFLGMVWQVPTRGGPAVAWATGPMLRKTSFTGANGIALHNNAVWAGNTDQGVIVRIPVRDDGTAGPIQPGRRQATSASRRRSSALCMH